LLYRDHRVRARCAVAMRPPADRSAIRCRKLARPRRQGAMKPPPGRIAMGCRGYGTARTHTICC